MQSARRIAYQFIKTVAVVVAQCIRHAHRCIACGAAAAFASNDQDGSMRQDDENTPLGTYARS